MMNKLEVGMYVRTKDGYIAKCIYYDNELENIYSFDSVVRKSFSDTYDFIYCDVEKNILKTSHNIIDLIEVGDYVNGEKVESVNNSIKPIPMPQYKNEYGEYVDYDESEIKSIVTKEQFSSMEYKVGGNNE